MNLTCLKSKDGTSFHKYWSKKHTYTFHLRKFYLNSNTLFSVNVSQFSIFSSKTLNIRVGVYVEFSHHSYLK